MELSVCIITKDDCENLKKCLKSLSQYPFEIVVVDTGSADVTIAMAKEYTESVYTFSWCDDFAKAKNYAISKAANDQVLVMDSDEYLDAVNLQELEQQMKANSRAVGRIKIENSFWQGEEVRWNVEYINRLFDRRYFQYKGKVHEQIVAIDRKDYEGYMTSIVIKHSGYLLTEEQRLQKSERNIHLLLKELEEQGEDSYVLYQLGKSYYLKRDYESAYHYFSEAMGAGVNFRLEYVMDLVESYGYAMLNSGRAEEALKLEELYHEFADSADFLFLMGLIYMNNEQFDKAVQEFEKAAAQQEARVKGVNGYLAFYNIGVIYECMGVSDRAKEYYLRCGEYQPAIARLKLFGEDLYK